MNKRKLLSLVVPVYFEEDCISQFISEAVEVLAGLSMDYEIIFVDDGSHDSTVDNIQLHAVKNNRIKLIELSYNHGKQAAVTAGITFAKGDYLLYMDPDLQDPPNEIPRFIEEIEKGYDLVFGIRKEKKDNFKNALFSKLFWWTLEKFTGLKIPVGLAVMRIFNRKFADQFLLYKEQNRFIEGIFMHIGMRQGTISINQRERFAGTSKFNFKRKMLLAWDAILDFSELPLKMAVRLGLVVSFIGFLSIMVIVVVKLFFIDFEAGWPSMISIVITGFGIQLFFLGIAALYVGRIYKETKSRPLFSIKNTTNTQ